MLHVGEAGLAAVALLEGVRPGRQLLLQSPVLPQLVAVRRQHLCNFQLSLGACFQQRHMGFRADSSLRS